VRSGYSIVDADRHVLEPADLWKRYLDPGFRERAPIQVGELSPMWVVDGICNSLGVKWLPEYRTVFAGASEQELRRLRVGLWTRPAWRKAYYDAIEQDFTPAAYLRDMDRSGVDVAVCFGTAMLYFNWRDELAPDLSAALCRAYNRWIHDFCSAAPDRLFGIAALPMHDLEAAVREAEHAVAELGLVGLMLRPNPFQRRSWHAREWDRLFAAAADLGKPICFHEGSSSILPQARLPYDASSFTRHVMSHPFEQMLATLSMTALGVLERHPRLRVVFAEAGCGWVPFWLERLDAYHRSRRRGAPTAGGEPRPSERFRRQCYVTCESADLSLRLFEKHVGAANVMWASDYPHPDEMLKFPETVMELLEDGMASRALLGRVTWDNAVAAYGLPPSVAARRHARGTEGDDGPAAAVAAR